MHPFYQRLLWQGAGLNHRNDGNCSERPTVVSLFHITAPWLLRLELLTATWLSDLTVTWPSY